jgi:type II secretory pathway pseudopilin PulG
MNSGFSIFEIVIVMAISLSILSIVIINISQASSVSRRIVTTQQRLEMIFHTVDTIKSDLTKCGMRLQEARKHFDLKLFDHTGRHFMLIYGVSAETMKAAARQGEKTIAVNKNEYFKKGKKVLIYHIESDVCETNEIKALENGNIILVGNLGHDYPENSIVIVLKQVEYRLYEKENILKRKVDKGYFQPLIEEVTDFYVTFFPESQSVLYKIEVNRKEQIRGYIFLVNMVS